MKRFAKNAAALTAGMTMCLTGCAQVERVASPVPFGDINSKASFSAVLLGELRLNTKALTDQAQSDETAIGLVLEGCNMPADNYPKDFLTKLGYATFVAEGRRLTDASVGGLSCHEVSVEMPDTVSVAIAPFLPLPSSQLQKQSDGTYNNAPILPTWSFDPTGITVES